MHTKLLITTLIFIFIQSSGIASAKKIPIAEHEIILRTKEGTIRAGICSEKTRIKLKLDRVYCGYYMNGLFCKQGELEGKALNGKFFRYDLNENILESGTYKLGLKDGLWKYLSQDGTLTETHEYRKGVLHGQKVNYKNGKPDVVEKYKKGVLIINLST